MSTQPNTSQQETVESTPASTPASRAEQEFLHAICEELYGVQGILYKQRPGNVELVAKNGGIITTVLQRLIVLKKINEKKD
jgi:hypothetical protein